MGKEVRGRKLERMENVTKDNKIKKEVRFVLWKFERKKGKKKREKRKRKAMSIYLIAYE